MDLPEDMERRLLEIVVESFVEDPRHAPAQQGLNRSAFCGRTLRMSRAVVSS